jgi:hypothetical protein
MVVGLVPQTPSKCLVRSRPRSQRSSTNAGRTNTLFVACASPHEYRVENEGLPWMLLATLGEGVETERWQDVRDRSVWLDYQLCRHNDAGEVRWTWRRTSVEMTQLYAELGEDLARRGHDQVARTLQ